MSQDHEPMRLTYRLALAAMVFTFVLWVPGANGIVGASSDLGLSRLLAGGSILALAIAFAGGVLTSLTPCVYPLIPITVSIFGAGRGIPRSRAVSLSGSYVLGIASMYSALGALAALTGKAFGSVMQSRWVLVGVALLMGALALSMLGAFELRLPAALQARLSRVGGAGHGGSFAMGLVAGIVAAPCTGPVLAAALTYVAARGSILFGLAVMFAYALGMGLLFFLIGTFSLTLPRGGPWMERVKEIFGVTLLVAAGLFLKDAFPELRPFLLASRSAVLATAAATAAGVLLAGLEAATSGSPLRRAGKVVGLALTAAGIVYGLGAVRVQTPTAGGAGVTWLHDEQSAMALARAEGRPMIIDFWADWCAACKELDRTVWSDASVLQETRRFVALKLDGTSDNPAFEGAVKKYGVVGLPTVVLIDSRGRELPDRIMGAVPESEMLAKLREVDRGCASPALACVTRW
jgi:thioredoxin:protein disulfide reductase